MTPFLLFLALSASPQYYPVSVCAMSLEPIVTYWADIYLVPRWLAKNIVAAESEWKPTAVSFGVRDVTVKVKRKTVTRKERYPIARGLLQLSIKCEAEHVRDSGLMSFDWRSPSDSARVGMCFVSSLIVYFHGELRPAIAGYNCGRWRAQQWWRGEDNLPRETQRYIGRILP